MDRMFLEISNVSKTFPGVKALQNVHFDIYPGEVHALVGENGAGKSTLIKILSGVYQPDEGALIKIDGKETVINNAIDAIKKGISVIYQDFSLFKNLTVAENIGINGMIEQDKKIVDWKAINKKAKDALDFLKADIDLSSIVENLSVAKQQMVAIASAVAEDAKMIIMDEPTSALSKQEVLHLYDIIDSLKAKGIAIMFVSHKMDELFKVADRFTVLRDGQYVKTVKKTEVCENQLISMMVGRKVEIKQYANLEKKGEVILKLENLSKKGNFKNINLEVKAGEVVGLTGLVGAGRSELAQAVFGISKPDSGKIYVSGKEVHIKNPAEALKVGISYIPESRQTQGLVLERRQREEVQKWIDILDVRPNNPNMLASQLSGGNQQKVVIAKWLSTNTKIIIIGEPTNGVDIGAKAEIHQIIRKAAADGCAVLVISSELPEILSVSDRILVMRKGRISGEYENHEITQEMIMEKAVI